MDNLTQQPVSQLHFNQLVVTWELRDAIFPNTYNPNRMTNAERELLKTSILEDGWTQPIVVLPSRIIVDGEQRWAAAGMGVTSVELNVILAKMAARVKQGYLESEVIRTRLERALQRVLELEALGQPGDSRGAILSDLTQGYVPITVVDFQDEAHQIISTIRHNRATGVHDFSRVMQIASDLLKLGLDAQDLEQRLGMDEREIERLLSQTKALERAADAGFSQAWVPRSFVNAPSEVLDQQASSMPRTLGVEAMRNVHLAQSDASSEDGGHLAAEFTGAKSPLAPGEAPMGVGTTLFQNSRLYRFLVFVSPAEQALCQKVSQAMGLALQDAFMQLVRNVLADASATVVASQVVVKETT
jgi:ParB-like chromosome segregation protein Spo0J